MSELHAECAVRVKPQDIVVHLVVCLYLTFPRHTQGKNPIDCVRFYSKQNPKVAIKIRRDQVCVFVGVCLCVGVLVYWCIGGCVVWMCWFVGVLV